MRKLDLDRLEGKIDKLVDDMSSLKSTAAAQKVSLDEHIRRTNILEEKMEPVEKHVSLVNSLAKIIGWVGLGAILKFIHSVTVK